MDDFIRKLLAESGLAAELDEATRDNLVQSMAEQATQLLNKRLIEALSPEGLAAFEELTDDPTAQPEQFQLVIAKHVTNPQLVTTQAMQEFRDLYLGKP